MTTPAEMPAAPEPPTTPAITRPPLSKVMLAMDVVDTLRHHRTIVETELNEEARERGLIDRVKAIYEAQGIEVPDEVIRKGVEALKQDRFTYEPPERTLSVRLAEIYVRRGWWTKLILLVLGIGGAIWGSVAYANHKQDLALIQGFTARVDDQERDATDVDRRLDVVARAVTNIAPDAKPDVIATIGADIRTRLQGTRKRLTAWRTEREPMLPDTYPEQRAQLDKHLEDRRAFMAGIHEDVQRLEASIQAVAMLRALGSDLGTALSMLSGVTISDQDQARVDALRKLAESAIDSRDTSRAKDAVGELISLVRSLRAAEIAKRELHAALARADVQISALPKLSETVAAEVGELRKRAQTNVDAGRINEAHSQLRELKWLLGVLDQAYELRVVSRPGQSSGITRAAVGHASAPNYYVQVEAIGADGRPQELEFKNEEDQSIVRTRRIAVRVPKSVYEEVRADKLKNGIVDNSLFGTKRRGEREPSYRFETTGRWIKGE